MIELECTFDDPEMVFWNGIFDYPLDEQLANEARRVIGDYQAFHEAAPCFALDAARP